MLFAIEAQNYKMIVFNVGSILNCWKFYRLFQLAKMVSKHFQEQEQKEQKAEEEEGKKLKRIASQIAKYVKEFWSNIEKV